MSTISSPFESDQRLPATDPYAPLLQMTALLLVPDVIWCLIGHWKVTVSALLIPVGTSFAMVLPLMFSRYRQDRRMRTVVLSCVFFVWFTLVAAIFSYLIVSTDAPMIDSQLDHFDLLIGFNWLKFFLWIKERHDIDLVLTGAYVSVYLQIGFVIIYLALADLHDTLTEFHGLFVMSAVITMILSGFFPAESAFKYYAGAIHVDVSMLSDFEPLRDGMLRTVNVMKTQGLGSIPSFHVVTAILLAYAMRGTRLRLVFVVLNAVVIISTLITGGHYLADVIAGAITVTTLIVLRRSCMRMIAQRRQRKSSASLSTA